MDSSLLVLLSNRPSLTYGILDSKLVASKQCQHFELVTGLLCKVLLCDEKLDREMILEYIHRKLFSENVACDPIVITQPHPKASV